MYIHLFNGSFGYAVSQEKEIKAIKIRKEEIQLLLILLDIVVSLKVFR